MDGTGDVAVDIECPRLVGAKAHCEHLPGGYEGELEVSYAEQEELDRRDDQSSGYVSSGLVHNQFQGRPL